MSEVKQQAVNVVQKLHLHSLLKTKDVPKALEVARAALIASPSVPSAGVREALAEIVNEMSRALENPMTSWETGRCIADNTVEDWRDRINAALDAPEAVPSQREALPVEVWVVFKGDYEATYPQCAFYSQTDAEAEAAKLKAADTDPIPYGWYAEKVELRAALARAGGEKS